MPKLNERIKSWGNHLSMTFLSIIQLIQPNLSKIRRIFHCLRKVLIYRKSCINSLFILAKLLQEHETFHLYVNRTFAIRGGCNEIPWYLLGKRSAIWSVAIIVYFFYYDFHFIFYLYTFQIIFFIVHRSTQKYPKVIGYY